MLSLRGSLLIHQYLLHCNHEDEVPVNRSNAERERILSYSEDESETVHKRINITNMRLRYMNYAWMPYRDDDGDVQMEPVYIDDDPVGEDMQIELAAGA